ncbi:MAG: peptidoglycan D,D-transpeptidase FtsI family protein [Chthoniobacteraceae bacterium]
MMLHSLTTRALIACSGLACVFTALSARLIHVQVTDHEKYVDLAARNHGTKEVIHARRGAIKDVNGLALAQNEPVKTVIADGSLIKNFPRVAELLSGPLEMPQDEVHKKLQRRYFDDKAQRQLPLRYIVLKKNVPESKAIEIAGLMMAEKHRGIRFEQDSIRSYPNNEMLCHVLGYTTHAGGGAEGIEKVMNGYLKGIDGVRYSERDRLGREIPIHRSLERPARNGADVYLTIDMGLQGIVESELDAAVKEFKPKWATCVLMRPTGEIVAMANRPSFDLNVNDLPSDSEIRRNRAIGDQIEPGSTFKIVPASAALNLKLVTPETHIFCENGYYRYGGRGLRDSHPYGSLSVSDILVKSSNIGAAKLAIQMGDMRFYEYVRRFGFGERTGVNLPNEMRGLVIPPHHWSKISITRIPMGHEVSATALQIATSMAVIANGGRLMVPQIISRVVDEHGTTVQDFPPVEVRRVVSEEVAHQVRDALIEVTGAKGTAKGAQVKGFKVAGKTGTAQKIGPKGTYNEGKYVVSFAGFMPAENPEFIGIVVLDEAVTKPGLNYGGLVSAPIFARIAERAARYLNLQPTEPEEPLIVAAPGSRKTAPTQDAHIRD